MTEPGTARLLVYSSLFPHPGDPNAGVFIRERMFRVARDHALVVVSPKPWSPFDGLIRRFRPRFRPVAPRWELQQGIEVHAPRFFSLPGLFKSWDSVFMALGSYLTVRRLQRDFGFDLIDAHFGYPDGHAASLLGRWLKVPHIVTLRGSERTYVESPPFRKRIASGLRAASRVIGVSDSLRKLAVRLGVPEARTIAIGNAVDSDKFQPMPQAEARARLGLPGDARIIVSVGWLIERKGFHRVLEILPDLVKRFPDLHYLIVGGATGPDSMEAALHQMVEAMGLAGRVHFLGPMPHDALKWPLSAADVFVLATRREGWANVFLEAMACGLPVVTTEVDGNAEVVCHPALGRLVPFGDSDALRESVAEALVQPWDRVAIRDHAESQGWAKRIDELTRIYTGVMQAARHPQSGNTRPATAQEPGGDDDSSR
ncbi:MAG: glycosyltransferase [Pseudomonadota bacterium]